MLDFQHLNETLTEKAVEHSMIESDPTIKIFQILYYEIPISDIDFDSFTLEDVLAAEDSLEAMEHITYIDPNDDDVLITDEHWISTIQYLNLSVCGFNTSSKIRPKPKYKFI